MTLEHAGDYLKAFQMYEEALFSSKFVDHEFSITVIHPSVSFAYFLTRQQQYDYAVKILNPFLKVDCEEKWQLLYLIVKIYYAK